MSTAPGSRAIDRDNDGSEGPGRPLLRVLVFAWACDPQRGSESAAGWSVVHELAEYAQVTVLTHPRHIDRIRAWEREHPNRRLHFIAVEESRSGVSLQQRSGFLRRLVWRGRYLWWLRQAKRYALDLKRRESFDVAIHVTLGIYWLPSPVGDLGMPAIWGPVDGAAVSPRALWSYLGVAGLVAEWAEVALAYVASALPSTRRTWHHADHRIVETETTYRRLPARLRPTTDIVNRALLFTTTPLPPQPRQPYVVFISPLERRKAPALALHGLAAAGPGVRLIFLHTGPLESSLRRMAASLGVTDRVEFRGKVPRSEMFSVMAGASACLFTGLREVGGAALAEAMLCGVPVIVVGHGGARLVAESTTDPSRTRIVTPVTRAQTVLDFGRAMREFCEEPPASYGSYLDQEATQRALKDIVVAVSSGRRRGRYVDND